MLALFPVTPAPILPHLVSPKGILFQALQDLDWGGVEEVVSATEREHLKGSYFPHFAHIISRNEHSNACAHFTDEETDSEG